MRAVLQHRENAPTPQSRAGWRFFVGAFLLVLGVAAIYGQTAAHGFLNYDDGEYVLDNPGVNQGFTSDSLSWAFTAYHSSNWHPLTWLSHMLDVELFGLEPGPHHLTSAGIHALNAVLCFLFFWRGTRRLGASWAVAALFALHPLRVESVAWVSERKDVLSGLFFFLTLLAYARFLRRPSAASYALGLGAYLLGLLSKPMLVTLPFVLLLLRTWPLRFEGTAALSETKQGSRARSGWLPILPYILLALGSIGLTLAAQSAGGALRSFEVLPASVRLAHAPLALLTYLRAAFWPSGLAYFHPHPALVGEAPTGWGPLAFAGAALLGSVSLLALTLRRRVPELFVGWFWFLGMLVPVIGIVQVGDQAWASRYAYLPLVGLSLPLVFGTERLLRSSGGTRSARAVGALVLLVALALGIASHRQTRTWSSPEALYERALSVTERNYAAHAGLANTLKAQGDLEGARAHFERALAIRPGFVPALYTFGLLEQEAGRVGRALALYERALAEQPDLTIAQLNKGSILAATGRAAEARSALERVLELDATQPDALYNLGALASMEGDLDRGRSFFEQATRARPDFKAAWEALGFTAAELGRRAQAIDALRRATDADSPSPAAVARLAWLLATAPEAELRAPAEALERLERLPPAARDTEPIQALEARAAAHASLGRFPEALEWQRRALERAPLESRAALRERLALYEARKPFRQP